MYMRANTITDQLFLKLASLLASQLNTSSDHLPRVGSSGHVDTVDPHLVGNVLQGLHQLGIWLLVTHLQGNKHNQIS